MGGGLCAPPPLLIKLFQLIHLNQACVSALICDLTDRHASTFWHLNQGLFDVGVYGGRQHKAFLVVLTPRDSDVVSTQSWVY